MSSNQAIFDSSNDTIRPRGYKTVFILNATEHEFYTHTHVKVARINGIFVLLIMIIKKFRSFKSKENIHKKEVGPYHGFGY